MKIIITRKKSVARNYNTCGYEISVEAETYVEANKEACAIEEGEMVRLNAFLESDIAVMPLRKDDPVVVEKVIKKGGYTKHNACTKVSGAVVRTTAKATLVSFDDGLEAWIPTSCIKEDLGGEMVIQDWILKDKGVIN